MYATAGLVCAAFHFFPFMEIKNKEKRNNNNDSTIKSNIAKDKNNRPSQMASWWRSNLTTTGNNTFMGGEIKMKKNKKGEHWGRFKMCFQVFRFSIFYGFSSPSCYSCFFVLLSTPVPPLLLLMMLPFGCATIWYLKLLSLLFAEFFICIQARSRWYLRQSGIWVFCFCYSHFLPNDELTLSFDNLTILCHCSSVKVLWRWLCAMCCERIAIFETCLTDWLAGITRIFCFIHGYKNHPRHLC